MRIVCVIVCGMAMGLLRGIKEGMVMIQAADSRFIGPHCGVRGHVWFDWYHAISLAPFILLVILVLSVPKRLRLWLFYIGLSVLVWECTEIGESVARYAIPVVQHEHVNFADIIRFDVDGIRVYWLHGIRTVLACVLLIRGGTK